ALPRCLLFFSSRRRHTRFSRDWSSDVCSSDLSPHPEPRPGTMLVQRGPYAHLRHPLYAGLALAALGTAISIRSWIALTTGVVLRSEARRAGIEQGAQPRPVT